ncbi:MAG TPA: hypothetical protein VKB93_26635 [Thermoanaerobaculia bacterium]|nr:hypothetical protein [Thermoanaerobaculia bacterium]
MAAKTQSPEDLTDRRIAIALFVLAFGVYCYFYGGWGANQEVNYALTRAIVEGRTFAVDRFTVPEGDIAAGTGGHIYSNKPPGLSVISAAPYWLQYELQQRRRIRFHDYWRTNKQLVTIQVCGIAGALIPAILFLYGRRTLGATRRSAALVAIAIAFGTIVLPYSTMLFAHVPGALFFLLAFTLLKDRPLWAGASAGVAGACFLLSGIAALVLVVLAWSYSKRHALLFLAGGVPFAAALAAYQWICFGSPLTTPLQESHGYTESGLLLGVFGTPRLSRLWALTFSEYRGLFFCSPVLLFALIGIVVMLRRRRAEAIAIVAIALVFLVGNSSFNGWHGGAAFGPRYLLPIIPLLGIAMLFVADRWRPAWLPVCALSITLNLAVTAVDPQPLEDVRRPLTEHVVPALLRDQLSLAQDSSLQPSALWIVAGSSAILLAARLPRQTKEFDSRGKGA